MPGEGSNFTDSDLRRLAKFMREEVPGPASAPPADANGQDAKSWKLLEDMLDRKLEAICKELLLQCEERFLSIFADLEMPMRTSEQRISTRKKMGLVFALIEGMQSWRREFFGKLIVSSAGWAAAAVASGIAVFFAKGGWH